MRFDFRFRFWFWGWLELWEGAGKWVTRIKVPIEIEILVCDVFVILAAGNKIFFFTFFSFDSFMRNNFLSNLTARFQRH